MTDPVVAPFTGNSTQRNRRLLLTLPACALPMLAACGGGSEPLEVTRPTVPSDPSVAPIALMYDTDQALYVEGEAITPNNAHVTGGTPVGFSVSPAFPGGLTLNARTGAISGTATELRRRATYTVSAGNTAGAVQAEIRMTVTGRGAWGAAATILSARTGASISVLLDGRVLVAGGTVGGTSSNTVQIFDPVSGAWSAAASLAVARDRHAAVRLDDGRVLVVGGSLNTNALASAEIYDPASNRWTSAGNMTEPRIQATAHLLPDGKVLVIAGFVPNGYLDTVEQYDPSTPSWTRLHSLLIGLRGNAAMLLPGGTTVLIAGGVHEEGFISGAMLYALDGSRTLVVPDGILGTVHHAVLLHDGTVLICADGNALARRFYPATQTWVRSRMSGVRRMLTLTVLADGRVLAAGGERPPNLLNTAEIYNPDENVWTDAAPMAEARQAAVAALLGDGSVLVVSGSGAAGSVNSSERYLP
ncbi:kelch-like protein [Hydrogenophaga sp.]|uniref:Kelch repeat-containing protein n=1 Tax=Hydrogenophaga sp. TaxID=1904254 RepID=UPI002724F272|nr:kelch-like protein [Hydrogenophaga sp.]MDO9437312.1 kelch repeat-containing protein [Hydrogenophaga sp.]